MAGEYLPSPDILESAATFGKKRQRFLQTALPLFPESLAAPTEKRRGFLPDAAGAGTAGERGVSQKMGSGGREKPLFLGISQGAERTLLCSDNQTTLRRL